MCTWFCKLFAVQTNKTLQREQRTEKRVHRERKWKREKKDNDYFSTLVRIPMVLLMFIYSIIYFFVSFALLISCTRFYSLAYWAAHSPFIQSISIISELFAFSISLLWLTFYCEFSGFSVSIIYFSYNTNINTKSIRWYLCELIMKSRLQKLPHFIIIEFRFLNVNPKLYSPPWETGGFCH